jgi:hypothetical protein
MPRIERRQSLTLRLLLYTVLSCLAPFILPLKFLLMRKLAFDFTACTTRHRIEIWACNATLQPLPARLEIEVCPLAGGNVRRISRDVVLHANGSTELHTFVLSHSAGKSIVSARLLGEGGAVLARYSDWPRPFVSLHGLLRRMKGGAGTSSWMCQPRSKPALPLSQPPSKTKSRSPPACRSRASSSTKTWTTTRWTCARARSASWRWRTRPR